MTKPLATALFLGEALFGLRQAKPFLIVYALIIAVFLAGCDENKQARKRSPAPGKAPSVALSKKTGPDKEVTAREPGTSTAAAEKDKVQLVLYFGNAQGDKLEREVRTVSSTEQIAKASVEGLIKGPQESGIPTLPPGTRLLGIAVKKGTAVVDFSSEFEDNHPGGSSGEALTVYSVVNTLTELESVQNVRFLVEGKVLETISGHIDLGEPVAREESLLLKREQTEN